MTPIVQPINFNSATYSRRRFLQGSTVTVAELACRNILGMEPDKKLSQKPIVFIKLDGGASLFDLFEMEPHPRVDRIYEPIDTSVPGLQISELLPHLSQQMHRMMLIKTLTHGEGTHFNAQAITTIGNKETLGGEDTLDFKHPGRFIELGKQQLPHDGLGNVVINSSYGFTPPVGLINEVTPHSRKTEKGDLTNPFGEPSQFSSRRQELRDLVNRFESVSTINTPETQGFVNAREAGFNTLDRDLGSAFNLDTASRTDRERYGINELGVFSKSALTARRLIEKGLPIVTIANGDWDYHAGIKMYMDEHMPEVDKPLAALIEDMDAIGGMVIFTTEFARSPKINDGLGRHHWTEANFGCISGFHPGTVVGKIDGGGKSVYPLSNGKFLPTAIYAAGYNPLLVRSTGGVLTQVKVDGFTRSELSS
jgi:hypothetical protein